MSLGETKKNVHNWVSCHPWTMLYIAVVSTANLIYEVFVR